MFETTTRMQKVVVTSTAVTGAVLAAPLAADAAFGDDMLYSGMKSDDVKKLQDLLKEKGFFTYHTSTGYYGDRTKEAVGAFQRQHQLTVDGIAGPQTFHVLLTNPTNDSADVESVSTSQEEKKVSLGSSTLLNLGDESHEVNELQRQLQSLGYFNGELNGYYGRQTAGAVRKFQEAESLLVDGIAGPQTINALKSATSDAPETKSSKTSSTTFKVLASGDKNNDVSLLQQQLKDLGYYQKDVTGIFGPDTEKAVRKFQQNNDLDVDGLAGPKTLNKLKNNPQRVGPVKEEAVKPAKSSVLRYGTRGEEVEELQQLLQNHGYMQMKATGFFGEVTEKAVRAFQKENDLKIDGIAGTRTLEKLNGSSSDTTESASEVKVEFVPENSKISVTNLVADAAEQVGTPYVWGGTSTSGFDCSGFLQYIFQNNGVELPRTVASIYNTGKTVDSPRVGDIVFFETYQEGPSHAGIYLGNNQFIHSGSSTGVTVSNMETSYWEERYLGVKRYF